MKQKSMKWNWEGGIKIHQEQEENKQTNPRGFLPQAFMIIISL